MELYLIRHGIAVERSPNIQDEERSLTEEGLKKTRKLAEQLHGLGLRFDLILTSPLARSLQTAQILHSCGLSSQIEQSSHLAPEVNMNARVKLLQRFWQTNTKLAVVGHQPSLAQLASLLVWGEARDVLTLKKAGIIGLTLPENPSPIGRSQMFLLAPPKFLL